MTPAARGALVVSLDFELHWGVRDVTPADGPYAQNLMGSRAAIPRMLRAFERHGVAATWATVGMLFARTRDELFDHAPALRPTYEDARLSPYEERIGKDEHDDPLHFAPSLVARIAETPRQELASHTYSHFYCLEPGQTKEQFEADLVAAQTIAKERGATLRSLVLPRNQLNPAYAEACTRAGFRAFRGTGSRWAYRPDARREAPERRLARLVDAHVGPSEALPYPFPPAAEPCDVPASAFVRPVSGPLTALRTRRLERAIELAARRGEVLHLWWHPHNFGKDIERSIAMLERLLAAFDRARDAHGMESLSMGEIAERAA